MSRKKNRAGSSRSGDKSRGGSRRSKGKADRQSSKPTTSPTANSHAMKRELVEMFVIALILACLFRTFEAEAFVIPTGSMAPTLMGRHKDLACQKCGFSYRASASDEIDSGKLSGNRVASCTCPNCRYTTTIRPNQGEHKSYKGDRILVSKFAYRFQDPKRWDVAVFKYPAEAQTNFIKRIVGLPGETIRIKHGDLYVKSGDEDDWTVARKSFTKVRAMMQLVHDNDYLHQEIVSGIWPSRWSSATLETAGGWAASKDLGAFHADGSSAGEVWLDYEHRVPSYENWQAVLQDNPSRATIVPQLVTDFASYNTDRVISSKHDPSNPKQPDPLPYDASKTGLHWVGDLAIECELEVQSDKGQVILELVEGGQRFRCQFDVAHGTATLGIDGWSEYHPTAQTKVHGPGTYRVFLANFDNQLFVSVNGSEVEFDGPTAFASLRNSRPTVADLQPARIGSVGAAVEVRHLKLYRDIYYIAEQNSGGITDYMNERHAPYDDPLTRQEIIRVQSDPQEFNQLARSREWVEFTLGEDQFLVFGDNSPESKDSRLWGAEYYVSRELLIGKALLIYWPHFLRCIPGTSVPVGFFPNFQRMQFVR